MSNEFFVRVVRRVIVILVPKSKPGKLARIARDARDDGQPEVGVLTRILGGIKRLKHRFQRAEDTPWSSAVFAPK